MDMMTNTFYTLARGTTFNEVMIRGLGGGIRIQLTFTEWLLGVGHRASSVNHDIYYSYHPCDVTIFGFHVTK